MVAASWAMGAVALACFTCSLQVGHVRAGRRVLAGCERRAVRRGLLLGCLVCVQAAEEVPLREPLGIEVLDLEVGQLRA
jgi:UDP-N-acetylglucosamine 2-epimerase